jgi:hypothetical protein
MKKKDDDSIQNCNGNESDKNDAWSEDSESSSSSSSSSIRQTFDRDGDTEATEEVLWSESKTADISKKTRESTTTKQCSSKHKGGSPRKKSAASTENEKLGQKASDKGSVEKITPAMKFQVSDPSSGEKSTPINTKSNKPTSTGNNELKKQPPKHGSKNAGVGSKRAHDATDENEGQSNKKKKSTTSCGVDDTHSLRGKPALPCSPKKGKGSTGTGNPDDTRSNKPCPEKDLEKSSATKPNPKDGKHVIIRTGNTDKGTLSNKMGEGLQHGQDAKGGQGTTMSSAPHAASNVCCINAKSLYRRVKNMVMSVILPLAKRKRKKGISPNPSHNICQHLRLPQRTSFVFTEDDALKKIVNRMLRDCPGIARQADKEPLLIRIIELMN